MFFRAPYSVSDGLHSTLPKACFNLSTAHQLSVSEPTKSRRVRQPARIKPSYLSKNTNASPLNNGHYSKRPQHLIALTLNTRIRPFHNEAVRTLLSRVQSKPVTMYTPP